MCSGKCGPSDAFINTSLPESPGHKLNSVSIRVLDICTLAMFIIGGVANISTVVMILRTLRLHKPFLLQCPFLALSDIFSMVCSTFNAVYSSRKFVIFSERLGYWKSYVIPPNLTLLLINVILLSLVQFLIFGHLLRSRIFLTNRKLVLCACTCLTLSIGYGFGILDLSLEKLDLYLHHWRRSSSNICFYCHLVFD